MRRYTCINSSLLLLVALIMSACSGVFVPDPIDPRLPKYTEEGNDVAGAFVNDQTWKSVRTVGLYGVSGAPLITVWPEKDSLAVMFDGSVLGESADIEFHLTGLGIEKFEDLYQLHDRKIQLDGIQNAGYYIEGYGAKNYSNKGVGQIYFKNVREGNSPTHLVLSGTFGFSVKGPAGDDMTISYGRFDYDIRESGNFEVR